MLSAIAIDSDNLGQACFREEIPLCEVAGSEQSPAHKAGHDALPPS